MRNNDLIQFRAPSKLKEDLKEAASIEQRTLSSLMSYIAHQYIDNMYYNNSQNERQLRGEQDAK